MAVALLVLSFVGFSAETAAQTANELVAKGGIVHLSGSLGLHETLTVPSNTHVICADGTHIWDLPSVKLDAVVKLNGQNISIENCDIYANTTKVIITIGAHSSNLSLVKNHIHSFNHAHGLLIDAPDIHQLTLDGNAIDNVGYGILQNVHAPDLTDLIITNNTFSEVWADAIELNDPVTSKCCGIQLTAVQPSGITITNNKFRVPKHPGSNPSAGFCVGVAGAHDIVISNNDCVAWLQGFHVEDRAYNIQIVDNTVSTDDHESTAGQSAIQILDGHHLMIARNKIANSAGDGIHIDYDPSHQASDVEITGNQITGCGKYGMFIAGGSIGPMNSTVHDNSVSGCNESLYLAGNLQAISIRSNHLETKSRCAVSLAKETNKANVDIRENKDQQSGAESNSTCSTL
jgi:hypothetical protein